MPLYVCRNAAPAQLSSQERAIILNKIKDEVRIVTACVLCYVVLHV